MKIILNSLLVLVAAAIGLAIGFVWRNSRPISPPEELPAMAMGSEQKALARISTKPAIPHNVDSPLARQLERDLSMSAGVTRWLYWMEALEKATPADFPGLIRLTKGNYTATRFVAARWAETAPRHMFDTLVAEIRSGSLPEYDLTSVLLDDWPKRDPDAAIAALNEIENFGMRDSWRNQVAYGLVEKDIERALRLWPAWNLEMGFGDRGLRAVAKWTATDPRHAAEFMLGQPAGYYSRAITETVGTQWAKMDPANAMAFAAEKPGELGSALGTGAIKEWGERNLQQAAEWLGRTDARARNRFSPAFVEAWAKQDATSALSWCEANLSGPTLSDAVGGALRGAADKNIANAATLVAGMNPSPARAEAALAVAEKWFPRLASDKSVPTAAVAWLAGLDADSSKRVVTEVMWEWATSDPKSMAEFLPGISTDKVPPFAYELLARQMAQKNPIEALEWTSRVPEERGLSAGSAAFGEWHRAQRESAMKWLDSLSQTDPRREPFFDGAIRALAYDSQASEQLAAMNPAQRATARRVIETMKIAEDRRVRLLGALK